MRKRKIICCIVMACLLFSFEIPVVAAENNVGMVTENPEPRNTNIKFSTISLSLSGGIAYCNSSVTGYSSNTSKVSIQLTLQKYNNGWYTYASWGNSVAGYTMTLNRTTSISNGRYRLRATYTANQETITKYSSEQTY